jgi:ABC-type Zn uptake system ZnuABC Zn-binding protein ZnuA
MRYLAAILVCLLLVAGFAWAMSQAGSRSHTPAVNIPPGALHVVVSSPIPGDLTRRVAGADAFVSVLIAPGADAHQYEPTPQDASLVASADLVIMVGSGFDDWMTKLAQNARPKGPVIVLASALPEVAAAGGDPHFWQDPTLADKAGRTIADALAAARPASKPAFEANAQALSKDLTELDAWIKTRIESIPQDRRNLFTPHNAMSYYASRYNLKVLPGLQGLSTGEETDPSAKRVSEIIREIKASGVPAIFGEAGPDHDDHAHHDHSDTGHTHSHSHTSNRLLARIAKDAGVKIVLGLNTDSLGAPGSPSDTYIKLMRANTRLIVQTLQ